MANVYGLLGYPLEHSCSSEYFNNKFESENIDAVYKDFAYEDIAEFITDIKEINDFLGFSVTMPFKESIIKYLDSLDPLAKNINAVNCVKIYKNIFGKKIMRGYNTDVMGFSKSFGESLKIDCKKALVLGTGGASRAVCYALENMGISFVNVSRSITNVFSVRYKDTTELIRAGYKIIINATPVGMFPDVEKCPDLPYDELGEGFYLYDLVYNPDMTMFLKRGQERGAFVKNGLDMLHIQADEALKIWEEKKFETKGFLKKIISPK